METKQEKPKGKAAPRRKGKRNKKSAGKNYTLVILIVTLSVVVLIGCMTLFVFKSYNGGDEWIYIPADATKASVRDSLKTHLGSPMGNRVYLIWSALGGDPHRNRGAYKIESGESALSISRRIQRGQQTPVKVSFNASRTMKDMARKLTRNLQCSPEEFLESCDKVLLDSGYTREEFPALFLPDSYEFYWSASPDNVVRRLLGYHKRFWTPERLAKAEAEGITPVQAATIASIVEEETAKRDERPIVARLYLNRLHKGMKLQADPTVKFATGDFSIRRLNATHIAIKSPYNTYHVNGLPPGPIRIPDAATIDAVLDAPRHNYIYMCAREDFSGYHNFAVDYETHKANARRYQAELNRRNIH